MMKLLYFYILFISLLRPDNILTDNMIQGRLNIVNGYSAECVMHKFYSNSDWIQIEGEVGRNGIDGLYYKKKDGVIREVLIAESKWNKSKLSKSGKHKLLKQMSQKWVLRTLDRLQKYQSLPEYSTIKKFVQHDQYRARLFRMFPKGNDEIQIHIFEIKNKGSNSYDIKILNKLYPIKMTKPKNTFQKGILEAYTRCRTEALHKYFPILSNRDVSILMKDNYLQKRDLKVFQKR